MWLEPNHFKQQPSFFPCFVRPIDGTKESSSVADEWPAESGCEDAEKEVTVQMDVDDHEVHVRVDGDGGASDQFVDIERSLPATVKEIQRTPAVA